MDELKRCPFCGGKAILRNTEQDYAGDILIKVKNAYVVGCENCNIFTRTFKSCIWQGEDGKVHVDANGAEEAINAWNRRVDSYDK